MKVKMSKILEADEKIILPLYFMGDENDEFVILDTDEIRKEFENKLNELGANQDE